MAKVEPFKRLQRKRLFEEVAQSLKRAIFSGVYPIGERLPSENELTRIFGVSRPVVREAIRYLEITGLLTIRQGATGGAFVSGINSRVLKDNLKDLLILRQVSVEQLTEVRMLVDPAIARSAALRAQPDDLEKIAQCLKFSEEMDPATQFAATVKNNALFHRLLGQASYNLFFAIIEDVIMDVTVEFILTVKREHEVLHDPDEHRNIFRAVADHDPDRAADIMRMHIEKIGSQMKALEDVFLKLSLRNAAASG